MQEKYGKGNNLKFVQQLKTVQMTACMCTAKKILLIVCSNTTINTALLRAAIEMYPLKTNKTREKS